MSELDEIIKEFLVESHEGLDQLDRDLVDLEKDPAARDLVARIFRTVHTIKGTSGVLGFDKLAALSHVGENLLSRLRDGKMQLCKPITDALLAMVDVIRQMLTAIETAGTEGERDDSALIENISRLLGGSVAPAPKVMRGGLGLKSDRMESEQVPLMGELLIEAGADREDVRAALQEQSGGDPRRIGEILVEHEAVEPRAVVEALGIQAEHRASEAANGTIRIDVGLLDKLMNLVGELVLARNQVLQFTGLQKDASFLVTAQRLNLITTELQEGVMKTRMQPIRNVWSKFPRVVRELEHSCGKKVKLEMEGADTELDKTIIEAIKDPLTHIVRNAIDHGIEEPELRRSRGKDERGRLSLRAFHEGGQVNIEISDDGAGIDIQRIKEKAIQRSLISAEQAARMTEREALNLMFLPGLSTAKTVTGISGRGVGMDVVKTNIERIGGTVDVHSPSGQGTSLRIKIPLTLAIIPALVVATGGERFAIPQISLLELVRVDGKDALNAIEKIQGVPVYRLRGKLLPLVFLDQQLRLKANARAALTTRKAQQFDFERSKSLHLAWKARIQSFIREQRAVLPDELGTHETCALGKWLYGYALNEYGSMPAVTTLEKQHVQFHKLIGDIVSARDNGDAAQLATLTRNLDSLSAELIALLVHLEHAVINSTALNIVVLQADDRQFGLVVDDINDTEEIVVKPLGKHLNGLSCFAGATIMGDGRVALILDVLGLAQMANVVGEVRTRAVNKEAGIAGAAGDRQSWLLFRVGRTSRMAIPLASVARLEKFAVSTIERSGARMVVQYRDQIMPIIDIAEMMMAGERADRGDTLDVIVHSRDGRDIGLAVDEILDVVEQQVVVDQREVDTALLAGSAVVQDRVTDILDLDRLVGGLVGKARAARA